MQRRQLLKQIGASSAVAFGAAGLGSAHESEEIPLSEANYVRAEVDGEMQTFTVEEFERRPDTQSLETMDTCCYECLECCYSCCNDACCWARECGTCSGC